jgi:hypothetical protein
MLLVAQLPAEVTADQPLVDSLELLLSFEAWQRLRDEQGLSPDVARTVLERMVKALVGE